ncbi:MAG: hypothetical protein JJT88_08525, partial [Gammaproteobacteria bacterium]|nr:hypothetical protein [Gammaproteobacteria bacterium]
RVPILRLAKTFAAGFCWGVAASPAGGDQDIAPNEDLRCGYRWIIPPQHVGEMPLAAAPGAMQWLSQTLRGGEVRREFNVYWSSAHLAEHIPGYRRTVGGVDANILIAVFINPRAQPDSLRDPPGSTLRQIFSQSGEIYEHYVVDANPYPPGHYRISNPQFRDRRWWVSKVDPRNYDTYLPARDWLVAPCLWIGGYVPNTERFVSCQFLPQLARDITLSVRLSGENINLHEEVIAHMARTLRSWVTIPDDDPNCIDDPFEGFP